jgi:glutamate racemase
VLKAIQRRLPNDSLIYLGDTARIPYATRSAATIIRYGSEDAAFKESQDAKLIVVACSTAWAIRVDQLERRCGPVLGAIGRGAGSPTGAKLAPFAPSKKYLKWYSD